MLCWQSDLVVGPRSLAHSLTHFLPSHFQPDLGSLEHILRIVWESSSMHMEDINEHTNAECHVFTF